MLNQRSTCLILAIMMCGLFVPNSILASGRYSGSIPNRQFKINPAKYIPGKTIFTSTVRSKDILYEAHLESQTKVFTNLEAKYNAKFDRKIDLQKFSGRLKEDQFDNLLYYIKIRYGLSPDVQVEPINKS